MRLFSDAASRVDDPYLRRALALAERGVGHTAPNPAVGCVLVRDGDVVGEGFHPRAGQPHAEVFALADAGPAAAGSTAYVTLEPCAHHGKTPPCAQALIDAGVTRAVIGMSDPNPTARGGAGLLEAAGIATRCADDPTPFGELNEGWLHRVSTGRPLVTVKLGVSLDAAVARDAGRPATVTGDAGAQVTQRVRAAADAVAVSAVTVIADDPSLTRRDDSGAELEEQPTRVVLVRKTLPPADARVFADHAAPTIVCAPESVAPTLESHGLSGVSVVTYPDARGIAGAIEVLGGRGVNELLIEAGPRLLAHLLEADVVDRLVIVTAGGVGGHDSVRLELPGHWSQDAARVTLETTFVPLEAGIVGDVSVTQWRRAVRATV